MKFCPFCGKEINTKTKFCNYCGKNLKKEEHIREHPKTTNSKSKNSRLPVFLIIIFIVFISSIIIFLNQRSISTESDNIQLVLPEEKVIDISQQVKEIKRTEEIRREGFSINEKPFDNRNYAYDERTKDFRLVCTSPCPVSKSTLDQEFAAISYAVSTLRGITQSDIDEKLMPFEVHASEDIRCSTGVGIAYQSSITDDNGYTRGLLCFFFDKIEYNRDKFPYSTSVHEVNHLFQSGKFPPYIGGSKALTEGLSMVLDSFFEKGSDVDSICWQGNNWYSEISTKTDSPHIKGAGLFFDLCNEYGFDYEDIPTLFRELDRRYGNVDEREFINIINQIVGADTSNLFRKAGVI